MSAITINSEVSLQTFIGDIREQWGKHKFLRVTVKAGKDRSLDQNAISHAWYEQLARELGYSHKHVIARFHDQVGVPPKLTPEQWALVRGQSRMDKSALKLDDKPESMFRVFHGRPSRTRHGS